MYLKSFAPTFERPRRARHALPAPRRHREPRQIVLAIDYILLNTSDYIAIVLKICFNYYLYFI